MFSRLLRSQFSFVAEQEIVDLYNIELEKQKAAHEEALEGQAAQYNAFLVRLDCDLKNISHKSKDWLALFVLFYCLSAASKASSFLIC